jgi:hypothetical protein
MYDQRARKGYLTGRGHEPRTTAWRPDLAAASLKGILDASRYVEGVEYQCRVPSTELRFEPWNHSATETQLLFGEIFVVYHVDERTGYAWGQSKLDEHVGFVKFADLTPVAVESTHWVSAPIAYVLPRPDRQAEPKMAPLCLNSRVTVYETSKEDPIYVRVGEDMWMFIGDLRRIGNWLKDPVAAIRPFADLSYYLWGHRDGIAFDCSALTQAGWLSMGLPCFRDADQQEGDFRLGRRVDVDSALRRLRPFDQLYWRNLEDPARCHLTIMVDEENAIHSKGSEARRTLIEPIADIIAWRREEYGQEVRTVKRYSLS